MSDKILHQLLPCRNSGSTVYITLGNTLRGDDGVGPYIAGQVAGTPAIRIINTGQRPERALDWAMKLRPDRLVFIDAADFGGSPGEIRWLSREQLQEASFSTHRIPLAAIMDWINHETGATCHCIGIQLGFTSLGEELSPPVQHSADRIIEWLSTSDNDSRPL